MINIKKQRGEVALFVVIFATLLILVVTVSYVRIMLQGQQQASTNDLSQSAYDSAQAGVEDAKRALLRYQSLGGAVDISKWPSVCNAATDTLNDISKSGSDRTVGNKTLNQSYTCVTVTTNTDDVKEKFTNANKSNIIPLKGVDQFDTVQIEWFSASDFNDPNSNQTSVVSLSNPSLGVPLLGDWSVNRPPVMRAQLIQFGDSGFTLSDFDSGSLAAGSNSNTLFLYPTNSTTVGTYNFTDDVRQTATGSPHQVNCLSNLATATYSCTAKISMPLPKPATAGIKREAYLRLTTLYNLAMYRITLYKNGGADPVKDLVQFNAVEPLIDSTGRADNLFRRVQTRVKMYGDFSYPDGEIVTTGNFCKNFMVTDTQYIGGVPSCTP